jgi:hypothetical protein
LINRPQLRFETIGGLQDDAIGGGSHAHKMLQFIKKRCNFQKA